MERSEAGFMGPASLCAVVREEWLGGCVCLQQIPANRRQLRILL